MLAGVRVRTPALPPPSVVSVAGIEPAVFASLSRRFGLAKLRAEVALFFVWGPEQTHDGREIVAADSKTLGAEPYATRAPCSSSATAPRADPPRYSVHVGGTSLPGRITGANGNVVGLKGFRRSFMPASSGVRLAAIEPSFCGSKPRVLPARRLRIVVAADGVEPS